MLPDHRGCFAAMRSPQSLLLHVLAFAHSAVVGLTAAHHGIESAQVYGTCQSEQSHFFYKFSWQKSELEVGGVLFHIFLLWTRHHCGRIGRCVCMCVPALCCHTETVRKIVPLTEDGKSDSQLHQLAD